MINQIRQICSQCNRKFYGVYEPLDPPICQICEDPDLYWCVTCGEEGNQEHAGNYYCEECLVDAACTCYECGHVQEGLTQDGESKDGEPWMVCLECKER